jgi:hypothetical protein
MPPSSSDTLDRQARQRAGAKLGWYIHACIYLLVNLLLALLSASSGSFWALYPALGWGLGLALHGVFVFLRMHGMFERMVRAERQHLGEPRL